MLTVQHLNRKASQTERLQLLFALPLLNGVDILYPMVEPDRS